MKFGDVHNNQEVMLLQCISGSKAYGLDHAGSDTDIRGVFLLPQTRFYGLSRPELAANDSNDIVYYELGRFFDLLLKNNPNILELLDPPADTVLYKHPLLQELHPEMFLSRLCHQTFAGYALSQVRKARGLNKKVFNPVEGPRKTVLDFCYLISGYRSLPLTAWLQQKGYRQEDCGLVAVPHARDVYALFHQSEVPGAVLQGIISGTEANDVKLSALPEGARPAGLISFNKDGYSAYCKDYREYQEWLLKRNEERFRATTEQGKNYDAKNMMHTFRLLHMAEEIAREGKIYVRRKDREFLLRIRNGGFSYDELLQRATEKMESLEELYLQSDLPPRPDYGQAEELLVSMRTRLYRH